MKILAFTLCVLLSSTSLYAQYQEGGICKDITMKDMDGNIWHLYELLDEGKTVVINVFDGASPASWAYHQSGALQDLYDQYGPNGDNTTEVVALAFADWYLLNGYGDDAQGNWLEGTPYPTIDPSAGDSVSGSYGLAQIADYYDSGYLNLNCNYRICPDKRIYRLGLDDTETLHAALLTCPISNQVTDAQITYTMMDSLDNCAGQPREASVYLSNMGSAPLTAANIVLKADNNVVQTLNWTGNLATYQYDSVGISGYITDGSYTDVGIFSSAPNGSIDQNTANDSVFYAINPATYWDSDSIFVEVQTDGYGHQIYWDITDANGVIVAKGGNNVVAECNACGAPNDASEYFDFSYHSYAVGLSGAATECLTLRVLSGMGYGICCTWGSGYIRFKKGDETIFEFTDFGRRAYRRISSMIVSTDKASVIRGISLYPNPTDGQMTLAFGLQAATDAGISVYNVMGQQVLQMPQTAYASGSHEVAINVAPLPNGMYWAVLQSNLGSQAVKFVVAK